MIKSNDYYKEKYLKLKFGDEYVKPKLRGVSFNLKYNLNKNIIESFEKLRLQSKNKILGENNE